MLLGDVVFAEGAGGGAAQQVALDVTDPDACARVAGIARRDHGRLGELVNEAGVLRPGPLPELTVEEFRLTLGADVVGALHGIKRFFQSHGLGDDSASEFALRALTKVAAIDLGPVGVRVDAVYPGPVVTDMMTATNSTTSTVVATCRRSRSDGSAARAMWQLRCAGWDLTAARSSTAPSCRSRVRVPSSLGPRWSVPHPLAGASLGAHVDCGSVKQ